MYDFTKNQMISMTNNFSKTDLKWSKARYSNKLGFSCLACYIVFLFTMYFNSKKNTHIMAFDVCTSNLLLVYGKKSS